MQTFLMTLSYDGSDYYGWQRQSNHRSVQGTIEHVLKKMLNEVIVIDGSGRTDTGVHANGQTATFTTTRDITAESLCRALNHMLPEDISINEIMAVEQDFHARYHAVGKQYGYKLYTGEFKDPFLSRYAAHLPTSLDEARIRCAMTYFLGTHDFKTFMAAGSKIKNTVRTIERFELEIKNDFWYFKIKGDGFLYHMVRIIIGTLIDVGIGKIAPEHVSEIILSGDRQRAKRTAPSCGLYLEKVFYND